MSHIHPSIKPTILLTGRPAVGKTTVLPLDVVKNGNRKLHAVDKCIVYQDQKDRLTIETLDAPLVASGEPSLLNFNNRQPSNTWGSTRELIQQCLGNKLPHVVRQ